MPLFQPRGGWIEVICGSMFCGKTEELIRRVRRAAIARQHIQVFKPAIDFLSLIHICPKKAKQIAEKAAGEVMAEMVKTDETVEPVVVIMEEPISDLQSETDL